MKVRFILNALIDWYLIRSHSILFDSMYLFYYYIVQGNEMHYWSNQSALAVMCVL